MNSTFLEVVKIAATVLGAFLAAGGIGAVFLYYGNKPVVLANARKTDTDAVLALWESYGKALTDRMDRQEKEIDKQNRTIEDLKTTIAEQDERNRLIIETKDQQIQELKTRVSDLERELSQYAHNGAKIDQATSNLHKDVDRSMNQLKKE